MNAYSIYPKQFNSSDYKLQSNTCFVIMPFSSDLDNTYMVIESVADSMNIVCTRADNISTTSEPILNKICTQISQAYFIVVDITNLNPNVFYELGIAHVLRDAKKVLIIKESQTICPSDINHLHYYAYQRDDLKQLKNTIRSFFAENNILEDLHDILEFLGLLPQDDVSSRDFVASVCVTAKDNFDDLIRILNSKTADINQHQVICLLHALTDAVNSPPSNELRKSYLDLILFIVSKTHRIFDIKEYMLEQFNGTSPLSTNSEWCADCALAVMDHERYFDIATCWIMDYLKRVSPAAFDIAKYKIEIGVIKSKSRELDKALLTSLGSDSKTLIEHCAKLIKERKAKEAIPALVELVEKEENPYVVRSSIDAVACMAPLDILLKLREIIDNRKSYMEQHEFISIHIAQLDARISELQNSPDF